MSNAADDGPNFFEKTGDLMEEMVKNKTVELLYRYNTRVDLRDAYIFTLWIGLLGMWLVLNTCYERVSNFKIAVDYIIGFQLLKRSNHF